MKKNKGNFIFNDSKRKYSLRKISGIGVVSALIGIMSFSSVVSSSVLASETDYNVNYHYVSTDELSKEEKNLVVNELPKDLVDGSNLFVVYKINSNDSLPKTGSTALNLASIIGAGLVLIGFQINKSGDKKKRIIKNILLISLVGGAFTVKSVSAFTISSLANYNHVEKISVGMSIPDGKINIPGYHFVGYIDGKNVRFTDNIITNSSKEDTVNNVNEVSSTEVKQNVQTSESENSKELVTKVNQEETVKETVVQQETQKNEEKKPSENKSEMNKEVHHSNLNDLYDNGGENSNTEMNPHDGVSSKTNNNLQPKVIKRVIKVDEEGKTIENIAGYTKVFEDQPIETKEIIGEQETTVLTIKEHYKAEKVINEKHPIDSKLTNVPIPTTLVEILSEEIVDNVTENAGKEVKENKEVLKDSEDKKVSELIESSLNTTNNKIESTTTNNNESSTNVNSSDKATSVTKEKEDKKETNSPTEKDVLNNEDKKENNTVVENNTSKPKENNEVSKPANNVASTIKKEDSKTTTHKVVRMVRITEEIPFKLTVKKDDTLAEGESKVEAEGKIGKRTTIHKITLVNDVEEKKDLLLETTDEAENRVIVVGTKKNNAASNENKEKVADDVSNDENKVESHQTLPTTEYTVEITNSKNNTVIKNREEIAEIVKNRNLSLNLEKPDKDKSIQTKVIEIKDSTLEEGKRQLQDVQASYVTVNVRKKEDTLNNNEKNELVTSLDIPLITKVYHVGTKNINFPRKDIVVSGHAYDSKRETVENATVGVYKDDKLISNVNTDVDGYTFTHLLSNQTYVLKSKDFEAKIITITNSEPIVQNITGKFELGKKYSDDRVSYHLKSNVINVDDGQYQTNTDDGKKVVLSKEIDARVGDILVIPPSKNYETPKAIKVTSVNYANNETVIEYSTPSLYEVINNIKVKSWETDISRATFIPAEGVNIKKEKNSDGSLYRSVTFNYERKTPLLVGKFKNNKSINGEVDFNINGSILSDGIKFDFLSPKIEYMNFNIDSNIEIKTKTTFNGKIEKELFELPIGIVSIPTPIPSLSLEINLKIVSTLEGGFEVVASTEHKFQNKLQINNWKVNTNTENNFNFKMDEFNIKGELKAGPDLSITPNFFMIPTLSISGEAGFGIEATLNELNYKKYGYLSLKLKMKILEQIQKRLKSLEEVSMEMSLFDKKYPIFSSDENNEENINNDIKVIERVEDVYQKLSKPFNYSSGIGNWSTGLKVYKDGTFEGEFHDLDMGVNDVKYPKGTLYVSKFKGKFLNLEKKDDFEYKMILADLTYDKTNIVKIEDGYRIITTIPAGLKKQKVYTVYLPGKPSNELPKELNRWYEYWQVKRPDLLTKAIIYNKEDLVDFVESNK